MARQRVYTEYPKQTVGFALHPELVRILDNHARRNRMSRSQQAENFIAGFLDLDLRKLQEGSVA